MNSITYRDVCRRLTEAEPDVHLVACGSDKRPLARAWQGDSFEGWQSPPPPDGEVDLSAPSLIGIVPHSAGLVVVDVDVDSAPVEVGEQAAVAALGDPLARVDTPSGGAHLLYATSGPTPNFQWRYGDLRGARGYAVVWQVEPWLHAMSERAAATPPDLARLPQRDQPAAPVLPPGTVTSSRATPPAPPGDLKPASTPDTLRRTPEGGRNNILNAGVFAAVRAGRWTPDLENEWRQAAADAGLEPAEIDTTIQSAVQAAEANPKPRITGTMGEPNLLRPGAAGVIDTSTMMDVDGFPVPVQSALDELTTCGLGAVPGRLRALAESVTAAGLDKGAVLAVHTEARLKLKDTHKMLAGEAAQQIAVAFASSSAEPEQQQGRRITWTETKPATEPKPLAAILDSIVSGVTARMHLPDGAAVVIAAYVAFCYVFEKWPIRPATGD